MLCLAYASRVLGAALPILFLVRGDATTRLELNRVHDLDKNGVINSSDEADLSTWFLFATTYRIIWGMKSEERNALVDTMPMKPDGRRMTTSEQDEIFAEQEQQSDESEMPRHVDYNAEVYGPNIRYSLLHHNGPQPSEQSCVPVVEAETAQVREIRGIQTLFRDAPNLQGQMAEYRPGRPLHDVFCCGMPEFFHIN